MEADYIKEASARVQNIWLASDKALVSSVVWRMGKKHMAVMDIGSFDGIGTVSKFAGNSAVSTILGVDIDADMVEKASIVLGDDRTSFICCDCESDGFVPEMERYLAGIGRESFDFVSMTGLLGMLGDPCAFLARIYGMLSKGGAVLVRDNDISLSSLAGAGAVLDEIVPIIRRGKAGTWSSDIEGWLRSAGFASVQVVSGDGLSTIGMCDEDRQALFAYDIAIPAREALRDGASEDLSMVADLERSFAEDKSMVYTSGSVSMTARKPRL
jgi:2-polyprenyl-3-methyl-5-hydroxy-6-metoxy-1,4-benzoquinol methylase